MTPTDPASPPTPADHDPGATFDQRAQTIYGPQVNIASGLLNTGVIESLSVTIHEALALEEQPPTPGLPPYKGLTFYDEQDESVYFGRRTLAADLVEQLSTEPLLTIVGASGSGKSSLARAGLLPRLRRAGWHCMIMRPSAHPLHELALALWPTDAAARQTFIATTYHDDQALLTAITSFASQAPAQRGLLIVDQLEELFTLAKDTAANAAFVANLLAVRHDAPLTVLLVLRADFYHRCADFANLPAAVAAQQRYLAPMTRQQLAEVILQPLHQGGWRLQEGLADLLLADTLDEPGSLPFLSHALHESWNRRRANVLTLSAYLATGGVKGAIAATAEDLWRNFTPSEQATARAILIELTELGEQDRDQSHTPDTRRRRTYADLTALGLPQPDLDTVLEALVRRRLLTRDHDQIEVAHEALIRAWDRLQTWLAADRETLRLTRQLQADAATWDQQRRDPSFLYTGARLAQAIEWLQTQPTSPTGLTADFLQSSQAVAEHEQRKELEHAQALAAAQIKRAEAETNRARTFRWAAFITTILFLLALVAAAWAVDRQGAAQTNAVTAQAESTRASQSANAAATRAVQAKNAQRTAQAESTRALNAESEAKAQATAANLARKSAVAAEATAVANAAVAQSRALAATSQTITTITPMTAWLLAIEAGRIAETDQAFAAINQQANTVSTSTMAFVHTNPILGAQWNNDSTRILSWSGDDQDNTGSIQVWDTTTGNLLLSLAHDDFVHGAAWNRNENCILSWSNDNIVRIWNVLSGGLLYTLNHEDVVLGVQWNTNKTRILSWSKDSTVRLWNASTGRLLHTLKHYSPINGAVWNANGTRVLSWGNENVYVWNTATGDLLYTLKHDNFVDGATWNYDETRILSWGLDATVRLWDAASGKLLHILQHDAGVGRAIWSPDGTRILSWTNTSSVLHVWDTVTGDLLYTLVQEDFLVDAMWNKNGTHILSRNNHRNYTSAIHVWDASTGNLLHTLYHDGQIRGVQWNYDESRALSWSENSLNSSGELRIWNTDSGNLLLTLTHNAPIYSAKWNKDETSILFWGYDSILHTWDGASNNLLQTLEHDDAVVGTAWNRDETRILSWSLDQSVRLWDVKSGKLLHTLKHDHFVIGSRWNRNETSILSWSYDNTIYLWNATTGDLLRTFEHGTILYDYPGGVEWSRDESRILSWSRDNAVRLWDTTTGNLLHTLPHNSWVRGAAWNSNETRILSWSDDGSVRLWDAASGNLLHMLKHENPIAGFERTGAVYGAVWNDAETRILSWSLDHTVRIWDTTNGNLLHTLKHDDAVFDAIWSRNGSQVLSQSYSTTIHLWGATRGDLIQTFAHDYPVNGVAWNGDETLILSWSRDNTVRLWNTASGELLQTFIHDTEVNGAAWNGDESQILSFSLSQGGVARLWDAKTGLRRQTFFADASGVSSAQWNRNETQVMLTTKGGLIYRYYTHIGDLLAAACTRAIRNLTWSEWQQYLPGEPYRTTCPNLPIHPSVPPEMITIPPP